MMDGRVGAIRRALDEDGLTETPILAYSAKFASAFYGPFREAADSTPAFGDRRGYQMDPANGEEAVREARLDVEEGADMLMVKPALPYLDVIRRVKDATAMPLAAYNVSGEYSMLKAAVAAGYLDERTAVLETLTVDPPRRRRHRHHLPRQGGRAVASVDATRHGPKLRARKDGAAIALDELDKRLLNLMQGQFPVAARPYQHVASKAEVTEDEVMARVQHLLDERIIRQVTPIFDTRALGYSSMLVAAKVDPEHPWRAANVINAHPGVSHNYLRNHEFNIWFTIATEPDSKLGLEGTLQALAHEAGAESVRQLPTLKLFKIRMDLEMEAGTDALATAAQAVEPAETEPQPYDEFDRDVIRAAPGRHAGHLRALRPGRRPAGHPPAAAARPPRGHAGTPAPAPRGRDPLPSPRRFLGQRDGRLEGPRRAHPRARQADGGVSRDLALLPAPHLRGLAVFGVHDGPRPLQGGVRRDPRFDRA